MAQRSGRDIRQEGRSYVPRRRRRRGLVVRRTACFAAPAGGARALSDLRVFGCFQTPSQRALALGMTTIMCYSVYVQTKQTPRMRQMIQVGIVCYSQSRLVTIG
ncbi:hypothetical protein F4809DRAFT_619747 [Biscogniauxia mediterranea]|nr:hypothetical protein F4809DRAFT_619747 [Biscogniauxia mediterranea]